MSFWAILLRVLLSVLLILNGVTTAAAATHMQVGEADMQTDVPMPKKASQAATEEVPCHQHDSVESTATQDAPSAVDAVSAEAKRPSPDCCKSGICNCACMHGAQAALPGLNIATPVLDHSRSVRRLTLAHPAPALPHLIRPPIG